MSYIYYIEYTKAGRMQEPVIFEDAQEAEDFLEELELEDEEGTEMVIMDAIDLGLNEL
jgi:hypothetical protein